MDGRDRGDGKEGKGRGQEGRRGEGWRREIEGTDILLLSQSLCKDSEEGEGRVQWRGLECRVLCGTCEVL